MISSADVFALCASIIKPEYYLPELRNSVSFILEYYNEYHTIPDSDQVNAESGVELLERVVTKDKISYCSKEIEKFCKYSAIKHAILASPKLIEAEKFGDVESLIRDAVTVSITRDLGIDYFKDPAARIEAMKKEANYISSGIPEFDTLIGGGFMKRQLIMFMANSGGGKSMVMANFACNLLERGLNCLYISLELYEDVIAKRFDSMVTGFAPTEWDNRSTEIAQTINNKAARSGNLFIKYMPTGTNTNDIRSYIKEFELVNGFVPDAIMVDYIDLMGTNEKVSADNVFEKDKRSSEQLRTLGVEYDMLVMTASQQNRSAVEATTINHSHIAGGISKINTADLVVSIIFGDVQRAAGEIGFQFVKTRNSDGVGKFVYLGWDRKALRIKNDEGVRKPASTGLLIDKNNTQSIMDKNNISSGLLGLMDF